MQKKTILFLIFFGFCVTLFSQPDKRPKLVVGIIVDQMRWITCTGIMTAMPLTAVLNDY
ncbi:MAG: hypothetical protein WDO19_18660 [Bacteroidota bacterium]